MVLLVTGLRFDQPDRLGLVECSLLDQLNNDQIQGLTQSSIISADNACFLFSTLPCHSFLTPTDTLCGARMLHERAKRTGT